MNRFSRSPIFNVIILLTTVCILSGCSLYRRITVDLGTPIADQMRDSFNNNCDVGIIKDSLPFTIAGLSGLIDASPNNTTYLIHGANANFAYAFAFVEQGDLLRARAMYLKARDYGLRALFGKTYQEKIELPFDEYETVVKKIGKKQVPALFWSTLAWLNYIRVNLSDIRTYVDIPKAEAMVKRLIELDDTYYFGTPHAILGCYYAAQPPESGGNPELAKEQFEKAIKISDGKFLMHYLLYAQFYAVRQQDKDLYVKLLTYIREAPEDILPGQCAVTSVSKMRAWYYLRDVDKNF
jgi:tetratricopeptide (TPR) repeat protein